LIEAGVDLSFDYCIRDLGPLDSILQVAGRVNRSMERSRGRLVVTELLKEDSQRPFSWIYDSTVIWATKQILDKRKWNEPELYALSNRYFSELEKKGLESESLELLEALKRLDFEKIGEFSLIEQVKGSLNLPVFLEIDENAKKAWNRYCDILSENIDEAKKYEYLARKKQAVRALAPYVVNLRIYTYPGADNYLLPDIQNGFCYVSSDELQRYYDEKTGLNPEGDNFYCD
jgi:CRISPR-associated endonuclease/helicase Cas3